MTSQLNWQYLPDVTQLHTQLHYLNYVLKYRMYNCNNECTCDTLFIYDFDFKFVLFQLPWWLKLSEQYLKNHFEAKTLLVFCKLFFFKGKRHSIYILNNNICKFLQTYKNYFLNITENCKIRFVNSLKKNIFGTLRANVFRYWNI